MEGIKMFGLSLTSIKLIAMLMGVIAVAAVAAYGQYRIDLSKYEALELNYSQAQIKATQQAKVEQAAQDQVALNSAVSEAAAQQKIVTVTQEVPVYVKETQTCITFGDIRLLDAAISGRDPSTLNLPTGQSDDACSPISMRSLAAIVTGNLTAAVRNAEQLTQLQAFVKASQR